jgi:hypothetical protein
VPTYVTGAQILTFVGAGTGTAEEQEWSGACAAAVQAAFDKRLTGVTISDPSPAFDELTAAARLAGAEAYKRKEATFGVTGYADLQNAAIRVAKDYIEGVRPIINRHTLRGPAGGIG